MIKESFVFSNYEIETSVKSKIDKDVTHTISIGVICPSCKNKLPLIDHGESQICPCGLRMTLYGNGLECEVD